MRKGVIDQTTVHTHPARAATGRRQRGQSTVEFAISSIVLLLLMTGLLDLSRAFFFAVDVRAAAREGARHGIWFNTSTRQNEFMSDGDIKLAVDQTLKGAGIGPSILAGGCPGSPPYNAPYPSSAYGSPGQVMLYICYDNLGTAQGAGSCCTADPIPDDLFWTGKDLNVIVLYNYPFVTGFLSNFLGSGIQIPANQHMMMQGHP
jgi:hypothetical protein